MAPEEEMDLAGASSQGATFAGGYLFWAWKAKGQGEPFGASRLPEIRSNATAEAELRQALRSELQEADASRGPTKLGLPIAPIGNQLVGGQESPDFHVHCPPKGPSRP